MDFMHDVLEEIALEGLDGITVESLWTRLRHRQRPKPFSLALDDEGKNFLWDRLLDVVDLNFFELPRYTIVNRR